jgi:hypothetical protein
MESAVIVAGCVRDTDRSGVSVFVRPGAGIRQMVSSAPHTRHGKENEKQNDFSAHDTPR